MKKYLLLFFTIISFTASAQISMDKAEVYQNADISIDDVSAYARFSNQYTETKSFTWTREVISTTDGWESAVCDTVRCYLPHVDSETFELKGEESANMIFHVYPDGIAGEGEFKVTIADDANPSDMVSVTYFFSITNTTNIDSPENFSVKLFPNPTPDYIMLSENSIVNEITIYNIIGRSLKTFKVQNGARYDISNLSAGMYLAKLTDADGRIIKTLRVKKQ